MEQESKKRGRGRPRKGEETPKQAVRPKGQHGGRREGAGRKKGVGVVYDGVMLSSQVTFRVRDITKARIARLREVTQHDTVPFNRMFEDWVEETAGNYGFE